MANSTVYPYGTTGELPSSIGIINDLTTGGANQALSAEMGKNLNEWNYKTFEETSASANLMDYNKVREGSIDAETGVFTPASATYKYLIIGPLPVKEGVRYYARKANGDLRNIIGYYYYAENGAYVSGWTSPSTTPYVNDLVIPTGVKYLCLRFYCGKDYQSYNSISELVQATYGLYEYGYRVSQFIPARKLVINDYDEYPIDLYRLKGKTLAILGDSIGTRQGYNDPEILIASEDVGIELSAYLTEQDVTNGLEIAGHTYTSSEIGTEVTFTPTSEDVGKSIGTPLNHGTADGIKWWQLLEQRLGMRTENASYSGATMVSFESRLSDTSYKTSCAWYESTIRRCGFRTPGTMTRVAPDYIFIHRGVNDFTNDHAGNRTILTENTFSSPSYSMPETDQIVVDGVTKYGFKEAYAMTIQKLRDAYPTATVICCTLMPFRRHNETHFPSTNGHYSLPQFNAAIREVAAYYGCPVCDFDLAYTYERRGFYTSDGTHPNAYGHRAMYEKALKCISENIKFEG